MKTAPKFLYFSKIHMAILVLLYPKIRALKSYRFCILSICGVPKPREFLWNLHLKIFLLHPKIWSWNFIKILHIDFVTKSMNQNFSPYRRFALFQRVGPDSDVKYGFWFRTYIQCWQNRIKGQAVYSNYQDLTPKNSVFL